MTLLADNKMWGWALVLIEQHAGATVQMQLWLQMPPLDRWVAFPVLTTQTHVLDQAAVRRRQLFSKANIPCIDDVAEARITQLRPLRAGDYGLVLADNETLMLAHGTFPPFSLNQSHK
jgi:hypothetical protein